MLVRGQVRPHHRLISQLSRCGSSSSPRRLRSTQGKDHDDLPSFLNYAERVELDKRSSVFRGTHYEYTVLATLSRYNFHLFRVGGQNDRGVDLVGHWSLPFLPYPLRVFIQCKSNVAKQSPKVARELEGAFVGAPPGWRGEGVLGLVACTTEATKGMRDAMARSELPMGFLKVRAEGGLDQFLWNKRAADTGLEGLGVTLRYHGQNDVGGCQEETTKDNRSSLLSEIALVWKGEVLPPIEDVPQAAKD